MKTAFMIITGLVVTMAGVGGIEQSFTTAELLSGLLVALTGCGIMGCAVLMIRNEERG
jgi:FtsH-binding integral membrane protein